jgi:hypothetical protein
MDYRSVRSARYGSLRASSSTARSDESAVGKRTKSGRKSPGPSQHSVKKPKSRSNSPGP